MNLNSLFAKRLKNLFVAKRSKKSVESTKCFDSDMHIIHTWIHNRVALFFRTQVS